MRVQAGVGEPAEVPGTPTPRPSTPKPTLTCVGGVDAQPCQGKGERGADQDTGVDDEQEGESDGGGVTRVAGGEVDPHPPGGGQAAGEEQPHDGLARQRGAQHAQCGPQRARGLGDVWKGGWGRVLGREARLGCKECETLGPAATEFICVAPSMGSAPLELLINPMSPSPGPVDSPLS